MNFRFANLLPLIDESEQVPRDSAVRTLVRDVESAKQGTTEGAMHYLSVAQALKELGYLRTALTYFAFGTKSASTDCLLLEQDGFARETFGILSFAAAHQKANMGTLLLAENPKQRVSFWIGGDAAQRTLNARRERQDVVLYREPNTPTSSGMLDALDRWFDLPFDELLKTSELNRRKPLRPLQEQPERGQLHLCGW